MWERDDAIWKSSLHPTSLLALTDAYASSAKLLTAVASAEVVSAVKFANSENDVGICKFGNSGNSSSRLSPGLTEITSDVLFWQNYRFPKEDLTFVTAINEVVTDAYVMFRRLNAFFRLLGITQSCHGESTGAGVHHTLKRASSKSEDQSGQSADTNGTHSRHEVAFLAKIIHHSCKEMMYLSVAH